MIMERGVFLLLATCASQGRSLPIQAAHRYVPEMSGNLKALASLFLALNPGLQMRTSSLVGHAGKSLSRLQMSPAVQKPAELVGVCTRDSAAVISSATRGEVRAQNLPHRCSYCLIVDAKEERVLVQKRVAWKETYPSHWDPTPGGVMGPDETFEENALRELEEEMGIVVGSNLAPKQLEPLFDFWFEDDRVQNWGRLMKVRFEGNISDLKLQAEEVDTVEWMNRAELQQLLETGPVSPDAAVAMKRWLSD